MIISRRLSGVPVLDVVAASLALCAIGYAPAGVLALPATMPGSEVIGAVLVLGIACTAIAFLLFFRLIAEVGPVRATVITYVNPAVAVAAGVALLGSRSRSEPAPGSSSSSRGPGSRPAQRRCGPWRERPGELRWSPEDAGLTRPSGSAVRASSAGFAKLNPSGASLWRSR